MFVVSSSPPVGRHQRQHRRFRYLTATWVIPEINHLTARTAILTPARTLTHSHTYVGTTYTHRTDEFVLVVVVDRSSTRFHGIRSGRRVRNLIFYSSYKKGDRRVRHTGIGMSSWTLNTAGWIGVWLPRGEQNKTRS